ncbi:MAG: PaaI family thioesterase [Henriciella sp.]|nr:PaaI family thioesterase [Henriciella sp.]
MSDDLSQNLTHQVPEGFEPLAWHRGFGRTVGPLFEKRTSEGLIRGFRVGSHHTNGMMNAHGGMVMTFADLAWGGAVEKDDDTWWVTVRLTCDFLSGAPHGAWIEGSGTVVSNIDGVYTVDGRIWSGDKTVMTGTGIFKIIEKRV